MLHTDVIDEQALALSRVLVNANKLFPGQDNSTTLHVCEELSD